MKKEQKLEQQPNSDSTADSSQVSPTCPKPIVGSSLSYETLAVIIKTKSGKYFQVALTKEMADSLFYDLKNYFKKDIIQVLPDEISGIELRVGG